MPARRPERNIRPVLTAFGLSLAGVACAVQLAFAGATTPSPVLAAVTGAANGTARVVVLDGTFDFPNALESGTALQLVVFQGTEFVRYPLGGTRPVTGQSPLLGDGVLAQSELNTFLGTGTTADARVRLLAFTPTRVRVALPSTFTAGPATAVVVGIFGAESVLSNPLSFVLP